MPGVTSSRTGRLLAFAAISLICLFAPALVSAQTQTGTLTGVVADPSGGVLPGVSVTISSPVLMGAPNTVTNERGVYQFIALPPGDYVVKFELNGFSTVDRRDIRINVAVVTKVDQVMQVAKLSETVTVAGESPSVDVKSVSKATNFDQNLLASIPQAREIWSTVEQVPGATMSKFNVGGAESAQQSSAQVHGSAPGQQEYAINGLKLNWPGGNGGATAFYFDHDSFAEISVQTNGSPAEVGTGGVYMNMVTKAGGNQLHGGGDVFYEKGSLQSDNVSAALRAQGVTKGNPINFIRDTNLNIGGPIVHDRLWYFGSYRRFDISTQVLGVVRPDGSPAPDLNHQSNALGKVTGAPNSANKISGEFNFNYQNRFFRRPLGNFVEEKASWRQIEPAYIFQTQWTSVVSKSLFLDARYGYLHLIFPLAYQPSVGPKDLARFDLGTSSLTGAAIYDFENLATRHQVNVSMSSFVDAWGGSHNFKTGFEFGRAFNQNTYRANGEYVLEFFNSAPFDVQTYNTPIQSKNFIDTISFYGQDAWTVGTRLTINYGGRFEYLNGYAPAQGRVGNRFFPAEQFAQVDNIPLWKNGVWRLGISYDLRGDGRTALKAFVGRYLLQEGTRLVQQVNSNDLSGDFRRWTDLNGNGIAEDNELGPSTRPFGGKFNKIDPGLKRPYADEFTFGIEHQLIQDLALGATYYRRNNRRLFSGINRAVPPSFYTPVTLDSPIGSITAYNQDPATLALAQRFIATIPGLQDTYDGVEITATKRMSNHWQLLTGLTIGRDRGVFDRGLNDDFNNPNFSQNRAGSYVGQDSTYIYKLVGTYIFPYDVTVSTNFRYFTGQPITKFLRTRALTQGTTDILVEPRGRTRLDNVKLWDIRLSKVIPLGRERRIEAMFDLFNLLNDDARTSIVNFIGASFGRVVSILPPRVARVGVKVNF